MAGAVTFGVNGDKVTDCRFEDVTAHATTNRMKLAEAILGRETATSRKVSFHIAGQKFFALDVTSRPTEEVTYIDVSIDTLYDLVVIEDITRQVLKPLIGGYNYTDRALLRRTRLLWEGEVVPFQSSPVPTTAAKGVIPQTIVMPATTYSIADTEVPLPTTYIRHPLMSPDSVTVFLEAIRRLIRTSWPSR